MSLRAEFVSLARQPGISISTLCARYGISRKTGYKWLHRHTESGDLTDRSRRPVHSPHKTPEAIETRLLAVRDAHPAWGARKLKRYLQNAGIEDLPSVSTITAMLHRQGRIAPEASEAAQHWQRFVHAAPNDLWQMDFKGHFPMARGRCHPLTALDDHSRFSVVLHACEAETFETVQPVLVSAFRRYGLPQRISCDNGSPWGTGQREDRLTRLGVWLLRIGIDLSHARPRHPQTNGKDERFHRTLKQELLSRRQISDPADAQRAFDNFRQLYNSERPHQAIGLDTPVQHYRPSSRVYPESLPQIEYSDGMPIRKVDANGYLWFGNRRYRISRALRGQPVALRFNPQHDGQADVLFCHHAVRTIDFNHANHPN